MISHTYSGVITLTRDEVWDLVAEAIVRKSDEKVAKRIGWEKMDVEDRTMYVTEPVKVEWSTRVTEADD